MMPPPPLVLPFCIIIASLAAISIVTEAFTHCTGTSGRGFAIGKFRVNSSRRRMRNDDDCFNGHPHPPSQSKKLLSLLSSSRDDSSKSGGDGEARSLVKNEISVLESSFLHTSHNYNNCDNFKSTNRNSMTEDDNSPSSSLSRFQPLLGLYEVKSVISSNPKENPVGGKWTRSNGVVQKLFRTRATFQHLLPFNTTGHSSLQPSSSSLSLSSSSSLKSVAEAVNVVSLDAFNGSFRITIVLRGDAVPLSLEELHERNTVNQTTTSSTKTPIQLSNLAVRAYFDPPRIYFGKRRRCNRRKSVSVTAGAGGYGRGSGNNEYSYFPLQLGPTSSVILDTTYCDREIRIGMGGTSGTRFVFALTNEDEANEYETLIKIPFVKKYKVIRILGIILAAGLNVAFPKKALDILANTPLAASIEWSPWRLGRLVGGIVSIMSGMAIFTILLSSGGIERGDNASSELSRKKIGHGRQDIAQESKGKKGAGGEAY